MPASSLRHMTAAGGLTLLALMALAGCASPAPTLHPLDSPTAPGGSSSAGDSCAEVYTVGRQLTETLDCTFHGEVVSIATYTCVGPERLGFLDSVTGLSETVWFFVPGVVTAATGPLNSDPAYTAAFAKCIGQTP